MQEKLRSMQWVTLFGWVAMVGCQSGGAVPTAAVQRPSTAAAEMVSHELPAEQATQLGTTQPLSATSADDSAPAPVDAFDLPRAEPSRQEAMARVLDDLMEISSQNPVAGRQLKEQLDRAQPSHWPLIVQHFRATLAYQQQLRSGDDLGNAPEAALANTAAQEPRAAQGPQEPTAPMIVAADDANPPGIREPGHPSTRTGQPDGPASQFASHRSEIGASPPVANRTHQSRQVTPASVDMNVSSATQGAEPICAECSRLSPQSWQQALQTTIHKLEDTVSRQSKGHSAVRHQVYLRLLYLMANERESSLAPVSGVEPAEMDYWSKQLFALQTYLDGERQPDDQQRAAAALHHLDGALRDLSGLSAISVHNLAFCKSVSSFGNYEIDNRDSFKPGERLSLYAEVENYRSEQREDGFYTSLATNYTLRKIDGGRVEGGQFPDVVDKCKNHRRDFHIQYGIQLPRDMAPGEYELRLEIKDNLSQKTGYAAQRLVVKK